VDSPSGGQFPSWGRARPDRTVAADFNGDGKADVVAADFQGRDRF